MSAQHTLLIVDDEPFIISALQRLFVRENYQILTANSGADGLELLKDHQVSLIISDQRMPEMIGAEFLARARELSPTSMRIMLTGYSEVDSAVQAINRGGIHFYLAKPWDDQQLKVVVRNLLEQFELEDRNRRLTAELELRKAELERTNLVLEQTVEERTTELRLKVKELEAKDRIAQHLLTVHPLDETLGLVLEVITEVMEMEQVVIYLRTDEGMHPVAATGQGGAAGSASEAGLAGLASRPAQMRAVAQVQAQLRPLVVAETGDPHLPPFAVVPVLRAGELLGVIEVSRQREQRPISPSELNTVASFALQAAVAINDAQVQRDFATWKDRLGEMLNEAALSALETDDPLQR